MEQQFEAVMAGVWSEERSRVALEGVQSLYGKYGLVYPVEDKDGLRRRWMGLYGGVFLRWGCSSVRREWEEAVDEAGREDCVGRVREYVGQICELDRIRVDAGLRAMDDGEMLKLQSQSEC